MTLNQHIIRAALLTAFIAAASLPIQAASLDDYHSRVGRAVSLVRELEDIVKDSVRHTSDIGIKTAEIKSLVPPSEKIDWPYGELETDNQWLSATLDDVSDEPATPKGRAALAGVAERLQSISAEIEDAQKVTAGDRSKDEDKRKLNEILSRAEYQKPAEPEESLFQKLIKKITKWLEGLFPSPAPVAEAPTGTGSLQYAIQILIYLAVIALVGFLIYKFAPLITGRLGREGREKRKDRVILGERVSANESASDLLAEAEKLAGEGRLREAIRKGYIAVLCDLADRKLIGLARHKTNRDYLRDIRKRDDLFEHVSGLTGTYERNWYGLRPSGAPDWEEFRSRYQQMKAKVQYR